MDTSRLISVAAGREAPDLVLKNAVYLDVFTGRFLHGDIALCGDRIAGVGEYDGPKSVDCTGKTLVPGFIDGHIHLESSVVRPAEFARIVLPQGTAAVVTDPHEIANVLGRKGVEYMLEATRDLPLDVYVMIPSCVPATPFDESGAELTHEDVQALMSSERVLGLAEMMNFVGTVNADPEVLLKIKAAKDARKFVDGHAPGLSGHSLNAYAAAGVESDHECTTVREAEEKLSLGQRIMIRDGTAGRNLAELMPLLATSCAARCMFVTDDKHPGDLMHRGHINAIVREAIADGARPETAYTVASFGAAEYFDLRDRGAIAPGYLADIVVLDDVETVSIHSVYRRGRLVDDAMLAECVSHVPAELEKAATDTVHLDPVRAEDFAVGKAHVIGLVPGELLTTDEGFADGYDTARDICKVCVIERHRRTGHKGICWIRGYGIQNGAVATSVSHDSHNIIAAGSSDGDIAAAVNALIDMHGGVVVVSEGKIQGSLPMPIAGLISDRDAVSAQAAMDDMKRQAWALGVSKDIDPIMTLSFVSLPVIPHLKLTTLGVVDVDAFRLADGNLR
jgi:adenine deaminase